MPTKVELLRCTKCGYTLTREKFNEICFAESLGKDNYIGLIEDGRCPECCKEALEDISLEDVLAAWNKRADRNEIIEDCVQAVVRMWPGKDYKMHKGRLIGDIPFQETLDAIRALKEAPS